MEQDIEAQVAAANFVDTSNGNGHSNGNGSSGTNGSAPSATAEVVTASATVAPAGAHSAQEVQTAAVQAVLADKMGDAPLCDTCGHITVRNGSCYRCLNCGESKGCS